MACHLYLSMIPEALIASMLTPEEFGAYYATGTEKRAHEQAIFFEVDSSLRSEYFRIEEGVNRCVPHEDGSPKRSLYISVYRVLEHIPLELLRKVYLVTQDGRTLGMRASETLPEDDPGLHLYQEIAPVHPLVASTLGPHHFYDLIVKNPISLLSLPVVCFVELRLNGLAADPEHGSVGNLPYSGIGHLRHCLLELKSKPVHSKMVNRIEPANFPYRTIKNGIFVGNAERLLYFPLPPMEDLKARNYNWWRSANM